MLTSALCSINKSAIDSVSVDWSNEIIIYSYVSLIHCVHNLLTMLEKVESSQPHLACWYLHHSLITVQRSSCFLIIQVSMIISTQKEVISKKKILKVQIPLKTAWPRLASRPPANIAKILPHQYAVIFYWEKFTRWFIICFSSCCNQCFCNFRLI